MVVTSIAIPLLLVLSMASCKGFLETNFRSFMIGYMSIIQGPEFILDKDCLSGRFDHYLLDLESAIKQRNYFLIIIDSLQIYQLEKEKCPMESLDQLFSDLIISLRKGTAYRNILKNMDKIDGLVRNFLDKEKDYFKFGILFGEIVKIIVYGGRL